MDNFSRGLDPDQHEAVFKEGNFILVAAAPGSGKTRVLASRFARLVSSGVAPSSILAITFTNRAASEMKSRVTAMTGRDASTFNIGTFHGFCLRFLKRARPGFSLCGREGQLRLLRGLGIKNPEAGLKKISILKNFPDIEASPEDLEMASLYRGGLDALGALDLDDLIIETIKALESGCPSPFDLSHIMVDEYQDINLHQARLLKLLTGGGALLFCIGDPDQAIYAFRGANARSFADFANDYPQAQVLSLGKNYRSGATIVLASRAVIENNASRLNNDISPAREGGAIDVVECADERQEAEFIVKEIEALMGGFTSLNVKSEAMDFRISDFAVLVRTNRQAVLLADAFSRSSVPFHVVGPTGARSLEFIEHLKSRGPDSDIKLNEFIEAEGAAFGIDKSLLEGFLQAAQINEGRTAREGLTDFLEGMLLVEPTENSDIMADKVSLLTLHAAKGLEFSVVFMAGVEDGLIPLRSNDESADIEEERRLFYVGLTRAKERLYLMRARKRHIRGSERESSASPFLGEIPVSLISKRVLNEKKKARRRPEQKGLFD